MGSGDDLLQGLFLSSGAAAEPYADTVDQHTVHGAAVEDDEQLLLHSAPLPPPHTIPRI